MRGPLSYSAYGAPLAAGAPPPGGFCWPIAYRRYFAYHVVVQVGEQEPAIDGHSHPGGVIEFGPGSRPSSPVSPATPVPATRGDHALP